MGWREISFKLFGRFFFKRRIRREMKRLGIKESDLVGKLSGYKTYITAGLAVLAAIASALVGDTDLGEALNRVWQALTPLTAVFIRSGMKSNGG